MCNYQIVIEIIHEGVGLAPRVRAPLVAYLGVYAFFRPHTNMLYSWDRIEYVFL